MDQARPTFLELEGNQVKICWNLKVNVLEKADILLEKFKSTEGMPDKHAKPGNLASDRKLIIKPTVVLKPLEKQFTKVGSFYHINDLQESSKVTKENVSKESDSNPKPTVAEDVSSKDLKSLAEKKDISSSDILALKDLLSDSERKLRDRKMKITSLKISLASMEKKNAEKKLSVQKRDRKIKELEEAMKIKDDAYKRFKEMHRSHSKENLRNCQDSLEVKMLDLELELSKKNASIVRLEEENRSLRKFKSMSRGFEKELASLKSKLTSPHHSQDKSSSDAEKSGKLITRDFEDESEVTIAENIQTESADETIESISSFLADIADTSAKSVDLEKSISTQKISPKKVSNKTVSKAHPPLSKAKAASKPNDNSAGRIKVTKTFWPKDASARPPSAGASQSKQKTIEDYFLDREDAVTPHEDSQNDSITTLSSDDEINLTRDGEEDTLLESMLEDHPTFSKEDVITIQEETVTSFLTLKPFASLCAQSDNIVEPKKRSRQVEEFCEIPSKRTKLNEYLRRAMEL